MVGIPAFSQTDIILEANVLLIKQTDVPGEFFLIYRYIQKVSALVGTMFYGILQGCPNILLHEFFLVDILYLKSTIRKSLTIGTCIQNSTIMKNSLKNLCKILKQNK